MRKTLDEYCRQEGREELLAQWDGLQNRPLSPETVSYGSKKKVWWRCQMGHHWQAAVYTRTGEGTHCPVCTGKLPQPGENDLATRCPALATQWHPNRNGALTPAQVLPGSHRRVWWICEKGHVWQAQVKSRVAGCGCPVCANREVFSAENSLATTFPQLAAQWHPSRNQPLQPTQVAPGTRKRVWWQCEKGHEWRAAVSSRTSGGSGCPVCAGRQVQPGENDLESQFPDLALQWHPDRNGMLTPSQVTPASNRKVWWQCPLGHAYEASVSARTMNGSGCPYCAGKRVLPGFNDLATLDPDVAKQWHLTLNGSLTPEQVTAGSRRKIWWCCQQGHVWKAAVYSRTGAQHCGCPVCAGKVRRRRRERYWGPAPPEESTSEAMLRR